jgi:histidine ammonia-lyase
MSTIAGRKLRVVLRNVQAVLAIELLVAAQAVEWRVAMAIDPQKLPKDADVTEEDGTQPTAAIGKEWRRAEQEAADFAARTAADKRPEIAARLGVGTRVAYLAVRQVAEPVLKDRTLDEDVRRVRALVEAGAFGSGAG